MPVLNAFLKVKGTFEMATWATTRSPLAVLIHLRLPSISHTLPFDVTQATLSEYYPKGNLKIIDLSFNLVDGQKEAAWEKEVESVITDLFECDLVFFFITNHSSPDTSDLWLSEVSPGKPIAALVSDVSTILFYHFILILIINLTVAEHHSRAISAYPQKVHYLYYGLQGGC